MVIFDLAAIHDHATLVHSLQYAAGMIYAIVNGTLVLKNREHTRAMPGQVAHGPGWRGRK